MRGEPNFQGPGGKAWKIQKSPGGPKDWDACVGAYQVNCPAAHLIWSWWVVSVISLRDIEGVKPAFKNYPEAEWEFTIVALNPDHIVPDPDADVIKGPLRYHYLQPMDVVHQFHGITEAQCADLLEKAVRSICDGYMSPDSDFRTRWKQLLTNTVEHLALGGHPKKEKM